MKDKENLFGKTLPQLKEICSDLKLPAFTAKQICSWLYEKNASDFDEMTNISKANRALLTGTCSIGKVKPEKVSVSRDGTKKYLFDLGQNRFIEAAMIPDGDRNTLCLSSQAGCKMGCTFCMTAKQGFQSHLTPAEILSQFTEIEEAGRITNIVYMGMGEPMDNIDSVLATLDILTADYGYAMSPKRITVSTIGVIPAMKRFLEESKCHLAISIHSPFPEERQRLMPVEKKYPIEEIVEILKQHDFGGQRRVSFEYIMFAGVNDDDRHSAALSSLLKGLDTRVNLIGFHPIPDSNLNGSARPVMETFQAHLQKKGITTTIRRSRGQDIDAACGLLSTKERLNN
ncbi:MAG: 23S rRNA (adenine(2503)-C(2))-methyltransferase RlmN [Spirochaetales bacterium]|nr:23S rRNA (adenine(2503)-C(2))-methyltransferase RlmN [Spirochaetales bacterium]